MAVDTTKLEKEVVTKRTLFQRISIVHYIIVFCIVSFLTLAILTKNFPYFEFDLIITKTLQRINYSLFSDFMMQLTYLGNTEIGILSIAVISGILFVLKNKTAAIFVIISSVGSSLLGLFFKTIVARPRPDSTLIHQIHHFAKSDSFPSGHVLHFMGLFGFLLVYIYIKYKKSQTKYLFLSILLVLLIGIGLSRIYLGAHWFSDVLGSYLLGFIWLYFVFYLYKKYEKLFI